MPIETTTPNLSLTLPYEGETSWDSQINGNFSILDQSAIKTLTALGNTTVSSTGTFSQLLNISGAGAVSIGVGAGSVTVSVPVATNYSTISITALGNTTNNSSGTFNNVLQFSGAGAISVGASLGSVTISAPNVQNFTLNGSTGSLSLIAGSNVGFASNASTLTISAAGTLSLVGTNGISLSSATAGSTTTISISQAPISFTQNKLFAEVYPILSSAGTVTAFLNSSLFLNRLNLLAPMKLTEVDLALALSFPVTSQGAGTMSQTFIVYSFGNSTSLQSLLSTSKTFGWSTGTSTTAGATSLSQFQGGWSGSIVHPFTFASTLISAGDFVVGNQFAFGQGSSTWTVSVFGDMQFVSSVDAIAAMTGMSSASANLVQSVSGVTAALTAFNAAVSAMGFGKVGSTASFVTNTASLISVTATAASTASLILNTATAAMTHVSAINSTNSSVLTAAGPSALGSTSISHQVSTNQAFVFQGTGSTQSTMIPFIFVNGIASVTASSTIGSIALSNTVVSFIGSNAVIKPWYALGGV